MAVSAVSHLSFREFGAAAQKALTAVLRTQHRRAQPSSGQVRVLLSEDGIAVYRIAHGETKEIVRIALAEIEKGKRPTDQSDLARHTSGETIVVLPPREALRRSVQLPVGAARNLRDILRHELDRHSPIGPDEVYFDYWVRMHDRAANKLEVDLRIVKRGSIEQAIASCRSLGLEPVSVEIDGDLIPLNRARLPLNRAAVARSLWRRWSVPALSLLVFLLSAATVAATAARKELEVSMLEVRVAEARTKASTVQQLRDEIAAAEKRAALLAGEKRNPMAVQVLSELTRVIPDGTWIYSFQLNGREVRIRGFSSSAATLIGAFDKSGFFANPQFRAPLTQGPQGGVERFDLSLEAKGGDP